MTAWPNQLLPPSYPHERSVAGFPWGGGGEGVPACQYRAGLRSTLPCVYTAGPGRVGTFQAWERSLNNGGPRTTPTLQPCQKTVFETSIKNYSNQLYE